MSFNAEELTELTSLVAALSVGTERLTQLVKGFFPSLNQPKTDPVEEGKRTAYVQILSIGCGIIIAALAMQAAQGSIFKAKGPFEIIALGVLSSAGAAFWNPIVELLKYVKDGKKMTALEKVKASTQEPQQKPQD